MFSHRAQVLLSAGIKVGQMRTRTSIIDRLCNGTRGLRACFDGIGIAMCVRRNEHVDITHHCPRIRQVFGQQHGVAAQRVTIGRTARMQIVPMRKRAVPVCRDCPRRSKPLCVHRPLLQFRFEIVAIHECIDSRGTIRHAMHDAVHVRPAGVCDEPHAGLRAGRVSIGAEGEIGQSDEGWRRGGEVDSSALTQVTTVEAGKAKVAKMINYIKF